MVNRKYFDSLLADNKMSLRALASRMEMGHSQLSLTFSGERKLQLDEAAQLARIFGEPIVKIIEAAGVKVPDSGLRVSVIGAINGQGILDCYGKDIVERTTAPNGMPEGTVAAQCRTVATPLEWMDGFVLFFKKPPHVEPSIVGRFSVCKIHDGPAVIAGVRRGYAEGTYTLIGPYRGENVYLDYASPVVLTRN